VGLVTGSAWLQGEGGRGGGALPADPGAHAPMKFTETLSWLAAHVLG